VTDSPGAVRKFRGRRWFALYLLVLGLACLPLAAATPFIVWFAAPVMGLPLLASAYACLTIAWGEAVAYVELGAEGLSLRLPTYRGYFPFWPAQRLSGRWSDVTGLRRRRVRASIVSIRFDYVAHWIETRDGGAMLCEPLPNDFFRNTRGTGLNLPVHDIAEEFAWRTGIRPRSGDDARGGGLLRNLVFGGAGARQLFAEAARK
jgi:hypothetical protein